MKKAVLIFCFYLVAFFVGHAQIENVSVNSRILEDNRNLKILLPRNYDMDSDKTYPIVFVFDGDYLFEPVAGIVDYLSYWEEIPECFVVGINQVGHRIEDGKYDTADYLPIATGARFYDFIELEVLEYMKDNYNVGNYKIAVGHDYMANFINFFLFSKKSKFQGYINLSPDIPEGFIPYIKQALQTSEDRVWYTLSTGSEDLQFLKEKTKKLYDTFSDIDNDLVSVSYKSFENTNHYTFVVNALPFALQQMFATYTPINQSEYNNKLSKAEDPVEYLAVKYNEINSLYDLNMKVRVSDIMQVSKFITERESWEDYQNLAKAAKKYYPKTLLTDYFIGKYYQEIGQPKKAIKAYQSGYTYEEAGGITKDMLLDEAAYLKKTFGY